VIGPSFGGPSASPAAAGEGIVPVVSFPGGIATAEVPPFVEGGSGGGIGPGTSPGRFSATVV
jgi:hypothetical protein